MSTCMRIVHTHHDSQDVCSGNASIQHRYVKHERLHRLERCEGRNADMKGAVAERTGQTPDNLHTYIKATRLVHRTGVNVGCL